MEGSGLGFRQPGQVRKEAAVTNQPEVGVPPPFFDCTIMAEEEKQEQYVVLARKYRPQNFEDLLGQDALVQTLTNAIKSNRLHHAYILTGIRGVGKTTTARLIAKALNCIGPDGNSGPTTHPCGICENCKSIAAGRNIDVLELDAASRTGVDDIRDILDGVRYKPTNCRYKIYIIDEVHMLSKNAFNALLKTLEEPPAHVKFIFATTEIRKVPVTVLSRCQRFDLQRLKIEDLMKLFNKIVAAENLKADEEALHMIAAAADGSARDGLSLLDQAISLGSGKVRTDIVKEMLGMADRGQAFEIFSKLLNGDMAELVKKLQEVYKNGANPTAIINDLINITHLLTKVLLIPAFINDEKLSETEKTFLKETSAKTNIALLSKIWQMLIKGLSELQTAPVPIDALEMILIRIAYSANLPTPAELLESVKKKSSLGQLSGFNSQRAVAVPVSVTSFKAEAPTTNEQTRFDKVADFINYLEENKQARLVYTMKNDIEVVEFGNGVMKFKASERISSDFLTTINKFLENSTGRKWSLDIIPGEVILSIANIESAQKEADKKNVAENPLVKAILEEFKGAKIETLTRKVDVDESNNNYDNNNDDEFISEDFN
uniref:DNA polymerase III subunit gamma/tau n=1 Tax=uncultured Alphaproteobacteria bacterium TaxID=91750 RepID=A0A6M4NN50_9PROT|nr:DNA polymerase III subunit gamma/tau [uncultured Alphaproteobacteria bacterium]